MTQDQIDQSKQFVLIGAELYAHKTLQILEDLSRQYYNSADGLKIFMAIGRDLPNTKDIVDSFEKQIKSISAIDIK